MSTAQYSLCKVLTRSFCDGRPPVDIPPYQRPYRWSISEVRKLLEDLDSFRYNPGTKSYDESAQYYYGTICFHAHDGKLELIDGQQRLTSFLILIKALLDVTDGINKVKYLRDELIETIKTLSSDHDWHENRWQPQYEYRQLLTQEHIAAIYQSSLPITCASESSFMKQRNSPEGIKTQAMTANPTFRTT